jgi:hypothetical protein
MYWVTQGLSVAAALNAILIGLCKRGAVLINPAIGVASIVVIEIVGGPRVSGAVVLVACVLSTAIAWYLWAARPHISAP